VTERTLLRAPSSVKRAETICGLFSSARRLASSRVVGVFGTRLGKVMSTGTRPLTRSKVARAASTLPSAWRLSATARARRDSAWATSVRVTSPTRKRSWAASSCRFSTSMLLAFSCTTASPRNRFM
jgi:hypothetical protein